MAKFRPGIPDTFTFDVEPVRDLGDYLDEPSPVPQRKPKVQTTGIGEGTTPSGPTRPAATGPAMEKAVPSVPPSETVSGDEPAVERPVTAVTQAARPAAVEAPPILLREERVIRQPPAASREPAVNEDQLPKPKAPRREISMTPETLKMSDELLGVIRGGSGQRDTKANELFHALVLLVHEAMGELDPHTIPKRGRWGTPTARAYPLELKNAFLRALLRKYAPESRGETDHGRPLGGAA
jgi:hypothetical protein